MPVHYKEVEHGPTPIERRAKVGHEDAKHKAHEWREDVTIDPKHDAYCDIFMGMMTQFESRWDGQLSGISVTNHGIELKSDEI